MLEYILYLFLKFLFLIENVECRWGSLTHIALHNVALKPFTLLQKLLRVFHVYIDSIDILILWGIDSTIRCHVYADYVYGCVSVVTPRHRDLTFRYDHITGSHTVVWEIIKAVWLSAVDFVYTVCVWNILYIYNSLISSIDNDVISALCCTFLKHIEVYVYRVHVQLEDSVSNPGSPFVMGLFFRHMKLAPKTSSHSTGTKKNNNINVYTYIYIVMPLWLYRKINDVSSRDVWFIP